MLVDEKYEIVSTFNTYVKPELGYLDYFISKLTGITKADLNDAPYFEEAIPYAYKFMDGNIGVSEDGIITMPLYMATFI